MTGDEPGRGTRVVAMTTGAVSPLVTSSSEISSTAMRDCSMPAGYETEPITACAWAGLATAVTRPTATRTLATIVSCLIFRVPEKLPLGAIFVTKRRVCRPRCGPANRRVTGPQGTWVPVCHTQRASSLHERDAELRRDVSPDP
jgi:hypothetical protein